MSFFDDNDDDEPPRSPRQGQRRTTSAGARRPVAGRPGAGRSAQQQAVQQRRLIAVFAVIVVIIIFALLIRGCESSATANSLKDYNNSVSGLIDRSDQTGATVFGLLSGASSDTNVVSSLDQSLASARTQLSDAEGLSVPSAMSQAQQHLLLALQMRYDGIQLIAGNIQQAVGTTASAAKGAVAQIQLATARFFASDVIYKGYAVPEIAAALHGDGISVGGTGVTINGGQFVHDLGWLQASYIATKIGAKVSVGGSSGSGCTTGKCGHSLNSVSVGGTQLSQNATNTLPASPAPTFTLSITNGGTQNESNVGCKVTITGLSDSGSTTLPVTSAGQTTTCSVTLPHPPAAGTYQVTAEVTPVPGETNTTNNFMTFPITFQ